MAIGNRTKINPFRHHGQNRNLRLSVNPGIKKDKHAYKAVGIAYGLEEKFLKG